MFVLVVFIFGLTLGAGGREFESLRPDNKTFRLGSYSSVTLRTRQLIKIDSGIQ
jgi:hypothetical protein